MSSTQRVLFKSDLLSITDVVCTVRHDAGTVECASADLVLLPRAGVYELTRRRGAASLADPNTALFLDRGAEYVASHPIGHGGDRSTTVALAPDLHDEILADSGVPAGAGRRRRFPMAHAVVDSGHDYLHRRLAVSAGAGKVPPLELEDATTRLVGSVVHRGRPRAAVRLTSRGQRVVRRVQERLNADVSASLSLRALSDSAGVSPYYLSRLFHRATGVPLSRYQRWLRVRAAVERLLGSNVSITDLAHDLGFADHSHLTNTMRRELGVVPSAVRRQQHWQ